MVSPCLLDHFYHSIITFTSLGYANIQPNLAVGHIPQILVAIESYLVVMIALLIFRWSPKIKYVFKSRAKGKM